MSAVLDATPKYPSALALLLDSHPTIKSSEVISSLSRTNQISPFMLRFRFSTSETCTVQSSFRKRRLSMLSKIRHVRSLMLMDFLILNCENKDLGVDNSGRKIILDIRKENSLTSMKRQWKENLTKIHCSFPILIRFFYKNLISISILQYFLLKEKFQYYFILLKETLKVTKKCVYQLSFKYRLKNIIYLFQ